MFYEVFWITSTSDDHNDLSNLIKSFCVLFTTVVENGL